MKKQVVIKSIVVGMIFLFMITSLAQGINGDVRQPSMPQAEKAGEAKDPAQMFTGTPPKEEWNRTFGGSKDDAAYDVQQTKDEGYIIGGYTKSYGPAVWNPWLIKTDSKGNEEWNRTYDYYGLAYVSGYIKSVQQTTDGGYILGCFFFNATLPKSGEPPSLHDMRQGIVSSAILIKTDSQGNEEWNRSYSGIEYSWCFCVRQTSDGGYIATGGGNVSFDSSLNVFLLKTYPNGTKQWLRSYGTNDMDEEGHMVQQTSDGGYIITGMSDCNYATDWGKIWLIKSDATGTMVWNKKFEGTCGHVRVGPETYGNSVQQTNEDGFIIAGLIDYQGCLLKTDSKGNETWRKTPFLNDYSFFCYSGRQVADEGYIATGYGLIKTDTLGNEAWNITFPTPFTSGQQTNDGGYVIAGSTSGYYNGDVWLIKFAAESGVPKLAFTVTGGLGVHVKITNNGTINASGVAWRIHVEGGILGLINRTLNGTVDIARGTSTTVGTGMLMGFGGIWIMAQVNEVTKTEAGTQFFIVTLVKK
jgi:hypothetical protein